MLKVLHAVVDVLGVGALILVIAAVLRVIALILGKRFAKPNQSQDVSWEDEHLLLDESDHDPAVRNEKIKPKQQ